MARNILLSTAYFGPLRYFSKFLLHGKILLEAHENYTKQTYRNRCIIATANGTLPLTVPVLRGSFHKVHIRDLRIDHSKPWKRIHRSAILSAYTHAPYFEFYRDDIFQIIDHSPAFLFDLNLALLIHLLEILKISVRPELTGKFLKACDTEVLDYRWTIDPGRPEKDPEFHPLPYPQVFSDRFPFLPDLSILDLLFNLGPASVEYLDKCKKKGDRLPLS